MGTTFTVDLRPVPTHACDHADQTPGHDPSHWLRHVIQVRDGKCSFPACGRHARESDFEHATAHEDGGKTCACNCHACSRSCHQVKQCPGGASSHLSPAGISGRLLPAAPTRKDPGSTRRYATRTRGLKLALPCRHADTACHHESGCRARDGLGGRGRYRRVAWRDRAPLA
jgi:hypothetical protein